MLFGSHMGANDLRVGLNLTTVHAQRLSFRIEWGLEIKGMGRWTVIVQVLWRLAPCALVGVSSSGIHQATKAGQSPLTKQSSRLLRTSAWNP